MQSRMRGKLINKICENCGKEFQVGYFLRNQRFCSNQCAVKVHMNRGKMNPLFKNGRTKNVHGYIMLCINALSDDEKILARKMIPETNNKGSNHQITEHRIIMAKQLGRPLESWEIVHHINGDRADNRTENLLLLTRKTHPSGHEIICPNCGQKILV